MWLSSSYCSYQTCRVLAIAAGERAHVAGDHHAVAGADARLVARRQLVLTVGALADEQRDRRLSNAVRNPAGAHDQLVDALDVERDALGSRVFGFGQFFPRQTPLRRIPVLAEDVDDRLGLHVVEELRALGAEVTAS